MKTTATIRFASLAAALLVTFACVQTLAAYGHPPVAQPVLASASQRV
jgi:hypothetical protein